MSMPVEFWIFRNLRAAYKHLVRVTR
jgi:hypothetical protein